MEDNEPNYESYAAPVEHGQVLLQPGIEWARLRLGECSSLDHSSLEFFGITLGQLRRQGKAELRRLAGGYTQSYRDVTTCQSNDGPIVMSGHQPELFHCGVWFKNFLISQLAASTGATPIHFIVDNDLCRSNSIAVPQVSNGDLMVDQVEFDRGAATIPWENRSLLDWSYCRDFASRVRSKVECLSDEPLVDQLWSHLEKLPTRTNLGLALSQARHLLERDAGLQTLEVPLSHLCNTEQFAAFSLSLLVESPKLVATYNSELQHYRSAHKIRNHAQPLPDLAIKEGWYESPWWCYRDNGNRHPLWVMVRDEELLLSNGESWQSSIHFREKGSAIAQWIQCQRQGMRIRPRALITTMFARLILSDLFIHGTGGGKYDQITNRIISRLFGIQPPPMVVASATMKLRYANLPVDFKKDLAKLANQQLELLNAIKANPDQLLLFPSAAAGISSDLRCSLQALASEKQAMLASIPDRGEKWEWHVAMKRLKQKLSEIAAPYVAAEQNKLDELHHLQSNQSKLNSREYSFCLHSLAEVQSRFSNLD